MDLGGKVAVVIFCSFSMFFLCSIECWLLDLQIFYRLPLAANLPKKSSNEKFAQPSFTQQAMLAELHPEKLYPSRATTPGLATSATYLHSRISKSNKIRSISMKSFKSSKSPLTLQSRLSMGSVLHDENTRLVLHDIISIRTDRYSVQASHSIHSLYSYRVTENLLEMGNVEPG